MLGDIGGSSWLWKIVLSTGEVTTINNRSGVAGTSLAIDHAGSIGFHERNADALCKITAAGIGPRFSAARLARLWTSTRQYHRIVPE